jgi:hypothetical protein
MGLQVNYIKTLLLAQYDQYDIEYVPMTFYFSFVAVPVLLI